MQRKLLGIIIVDSVTTDELLIICSAYVTYFRKAANTAKQCVSYLYISRKLTIHFRREVLYDSD